MTSRARVLAALATVYDPELDEPITSLGFVGSCAVSRSGDVAVRLRLPTPQCAPNFAYLMVADASDAVGGLPGVGRVTVALDDHYTADEINTAVARGAGFGDAFPGETTGDLDALRTLFRRKALLARQGRVCEALLTQGCEPTAIVALRLSELPASPDAQRCVELRCELGLSHDGAAPALVAGDGTPLAVEDLAAWRSRARLMALGLESNGGLCRSLLRVRYGVADPTEEVAA